MSFTPILRALLSAITSFGGHFLNRRIDRVASIGTLLATAAMISAGGWVALSAFSAPSPTFWALIVPVALVGSIAIVSAGVTFLDAHQPLAPPTRTLRVASVPLSLFGFLVLASLLVTVLLPTPMLDTFPEPAAEPAGKVVFGSPPERAFTFHSDSPSIPEPPKGDERLRGRIMLDGAGIEGAKLTLSLNEQYEVALDSNSQGAFEARLPAGQWHINDVAVRDWVGRPTNRELLLFSSHEPNKRGGLYSRFDYRLADGLPVSLPSAPDSTPIQLEFRDAIQVTWPPRGAAPPDAEFSTAAIAWLPVAGASEYQVQIARVEYPEYGTMEFAMVTRDLSGLSLPLATLPQRTPVEDEDIYSVRIFAFDAEGRLLTENNPKSESRTFKLSGSIRLGKEQQYVGFEGPRKVISAEYELNQTRLDLARRLMNQRRFDDARQMLDQVTHDAQCGGASVMRARLFAMQGDCAAAIKMFDKAEAEGGCVSDDDRKLCAVSRR